MFDASNKPDRDGCTENRLNDCSIELNQLFLHYVELPELTWEVHSLNDCVGIRFSFQVQGDVGSQEHEGFRRGHSAVIHGEGRHCWGVPPEI